LVVIDVYEQIEEISGVAARKDELLSLHTTFGVGGPCDLMVWVSNMEALRQVITLASTHSLPLMLLGNGSNMLVRDGGIPGIVLRLAGDFSTVSVAGEHITAGAGAGLADVVGKATSHGLCGLDFLAGIPGTVGGAVATNAGSRDVWTSHRLVQLKALAPDLREIELVEGAVEFGYRHCSLDRDWIVTGAVLSGYPCSVEEARRGVEDHLDRRRATQPVGDATAGCVFKNPPGDSAGRMIDEVGLKGHRVGGAQISTLHANWIVNAGGATAGEILDLINLAASRVRDRYGTELELEIAVMGID
jgi:UDP-N-acetylmuramate dehydrogenase